VPNLCGYHTLCYDQVVWFILSLTVILRTCYENKQSFPAFKNQSRENGALIIIIIMRRRKIEENEEEEVTFLVHFFDLILAIFKMSHHRITRRH
jgi:hypothetical protein